MKRVHRHPGVEDAWLTFSDFQAWFLVYSASTRSGASLDSRTRGSRSGLVLDVCAKDEREGENDGKKEEGVREQSYPLATVPPTGYKEYSNSTTSNWVHWAYTHVHNVNILPLGLTWSPWRSLWTLSSSKATERLTYRTRFNINVSSPCHRRRDGWFFFQPATQIVL